MFFEPILSSDTSRPWDSLLDTQAYDLRSVFSSKKGLENHICKMPRRWFMQKQLPFHVVSKPILLENFFQNVRSLLYKVILCPHHQIMSGYIVFRFSVCAYVYTSFRTYVCTCLRDKSSTASNPRSSQNYSTNKLEDIF